MPNSGLIKIKLEFINITNESKEIHEMRKKKTYRNNEDISAGLLEMSFVICYWLLLVGAVADAVVYVIIIYFYSF